MYKANTVDVSKSSPPPSTGGNFGNSGESWGPSQAAFSTGSISADGFPSSLTTPSVAFELLPTGVIVHRSGASYMPDEIPERGKISEFTKKARCRLWERLMRIPWSDYLTGKHSPTSAGYMVTLTMPGLDPGHTEACRAFARFRERLGRHYPGSCGVWVKELQQRGALHWHTLIFLTERANVCDFRKWIVAHWWESCGSRELAHLAYGTRVERLRQEQGTGRLIRYLGKYLSKGSGDGEYGRRWGLWGGVPLMTGDMLPVDTGAVVEFCRRVRKWAKWSPFLKHVTKGSLPRCLLDAGGLLRGLSPPP